MWKVSCQDMGGQRGILSLDRVAQVCSGTKHHVNPGVRVQPGGSPSVSLMETAQPLPSAHCGWVSLLPETDHLIRDNPSKDPREDTAGVEAKFCLYILPQFLQFYMPPLLTCKMGFLGCSHCGPVYPSPPKLQRS